MCANGIFNSVANFLERSAMWIRSFSKDEQAEIFYIPKEYVEQFYTLHDALKFAENHKASGAREKYVLWEFLETIIPEIKEGGFWEYNLSKCKINAPRISKSKKHPF